MGAELVPTPKAPKNRSLAIRLISKFYQMCMLLFGRSARALKTLAMEGSLYTSAHFLHSFSCVANWPNHTAKTTSCAEVSMTALPALQILPD